MFGLLVVYVNICCIPCCFGSSPRQHICTILLRAPLRHSGGFLQSSCGVAAEIALRNVALCCWGIQRSTIDYPSIVITSSDGSPAGRSFVSYHCDHYHMDTLIYIVTITNHNQQNIINNSPTVHQTITNKSSTMNQH